MTAMHIVPIVLHIPEPRDNVDARTQEVAQALSRLGFRHVVTTTTGTHIWQDHEEPSPETYAQEVPAVRPAAPGLLFKPGPY